MASLGNVVGNKTDKPDIKVIVALPASPHSHSALLQQIQSQQQAATVPQQVNDLLEGVAQQGAAAKSNGQATASSAQSTQNASKADSVVEVPPEIMAGMARRYAFLADFGVQLGEADDTQNVHQASTLYSSQSAQASSFQQTMEDIETSLVRPLLWEPFFASFL